MTIRLNALFLAIFTSHSALAWGPVGHEVSADLATKHLSQSTQKMLEKLLPGESLVEVSTWADRMRGNPNQFWRSRASALHYVTVPDAKTYSSEISPAKGDAVTALVEFKEILLNPRSSRVHKQLALRFSIHIVADLHQPLHVGNGRDRGGNQIALKRKGKATNLHRLWDSGLIFERSWNKMRWRKHLAGGVDDHLLQAWRAGADPITWVAESQALRPKVYAYESLVSDRYTAESLLIVDLRLRQAAIRTAEYLNMLAASMR